MNNNTIIGQIVELKDTPVYNYLNEQTKISGQFEVIEFCPIEPSNYVWSPCFILSPPLTEGAVEWSEKSDFTIDADVLDELIDPEGYARRQEQEDELYNRIEEDDKARMEGEGG
jgi:hypothetical protein